MIHGFRQFGRIDLRDSQEDAAFFLGWFTGDGLHPDKTLIDRRKLGNRGYGRNPQTYLLAQILLGRALIKICRAFFRRDQRTGKKKQPR